MRVKEGQGVFAAYLLMVGAGSLPVYNANPKLSIFVKELHGVGSPINFIYSDLQSILFSPEISKRAILSPKNEDCDDINKQVLDRIQGEFMTYISVDTLITEEINRKDFQIPIEYLNSIEASGLPRHCLNFKIGAIVMMMRNFNTPRGIINGTRMQIVRMYRNSIECKILTGSSTGECILIPRIKISPSSEQFPFNFTRLQFPLQLAFCMTITKSQGQSLNKVAIWLPEPCFAHGQLYVALSRSTTFDGVRIFIREGPEQIILPDGSFTTRNVVYQYIL